MVYNRLLNQIWNSIWKYLNNKKLLSKRAKMALYRLPEYHSSNSWVGPFFLPQGCNWSFESIDPSVQKYRFEIDFQYGNCGNHLFFVCLFFFFFFFFFFFSIEFRSISHLDTPYQVSSQLAFPLRRSTSKWIFKMVAMDVILDFQSEQF